MNVGRHLSPAAALGIVILAIGLALGLKARRYVAGATPPVDAVHAQVEAAMAAAGWTVGRLVRFPEGMPMLAAELAREGCSGTLTIAYLGRNAELMPYVRLALGPQARLIGIGLDGGRIVARDGAGAQLLAVAGSTACVLPPFLGSGGGARP